MALGPGSRLGPYEIVAPLGAGGMGQVYRARDTRLGRDVAIKVISSELAGKPELLARFEREARAVAALSHPNILAIHDVGTHDGTAYTVMELLDGQTLRARLSEGRLPARKAIEISLQIADGLAAAHDKGIVHRDLKPDNVFLTRDGHVKILDFGLAKLQSAAQASATSAPTELAGTVPGVVMGTAGYMAPEQVRGQNADHRADLFAFGAIVYEMLAGTRAFKGDSAVETMNAILKDDPSDVLTSGAMVPAALDRVVRRCLEKNPDERFQSARDLAFALQAVSGVVDSGSSAAVAFKGASRAAGARPYVLGGVIGAALASAIAAALWLAGPAPVTPPRRVVRFTLEIPVGRSLQSFVLAPDGSRLAYVASEGGQPRIYLHGFDRANDVALAGTEGAIAPFFSPDSQWIAFFAGGRLRKVAARGGEVLSVAEAPFSGTENAKEPTGTWAGETIIFSVGDRGLLRVPASGGSATSVTAPSGEGNDLLHLWPHVPAGGTAALFTVTTSADYDIGSVDSVPLGGGPRTKAIAAGAHAIHLPTGHVVYAAGGQLVTARFDAESQTAADDRVVLVDYLGYRGKVPLFDLSAAGDLAYAGAAELPTPHLLRVDRQGREESLRGSVPGLAATLNLSLDGTRLVGYRGSLERRFFLWMLDLQRGIQTQIPIDGNPHVPVWLPDGRTLTFSSDREGPFNLFLQPADGNGPAERLTDSPLHEDPGNWSRDGRWLTYTAVASKTGTDIWVYDRTARRVVPVRQSPADERFPSLSPDGRWLAYVSDESGRQEVYVEAFPGGAGRVQLSGDGGTEPVWSATGREIFYRTGTRLMSVSVQTGTTLTATSPVQLFAGSFDPGNSYGPPGYAVAPDGQHFYFLRGSLMSSSPPRIHVVLNWIDEFKRRIAK